MFVHTYECEFEEKRRHFKEPKDSFLTLFLSFEKKSFQETFSFVPQCETPREGFLSLSLDTISFFTHRRHDLAQNV